MGLPISVPFRISVPGTSSKSVASKQLTGVRLIREALLVFPGSTSSLLKYRVFQSNNPDVPGSGVPSGVDLWSDIVSSGEFVGESIAYVVPVNIKPKYDPFYLKLYGENGTTSALIGSAVIYCA